MFPLLTTPLNLFRHHVKDLEEIREANLGDGAISFCYMVAGATTFSTPWARECRGIVFSEATGQVISRPLHKFFNLNERESTQVSELDWTKVVSVMVKRDGSFIHPVPLPNGRLRMKSKKTFTSDVALAAQAYMDNEPNGFVRRFCEHLVERDYTPIFEYTAPDARIVLYYSKPLLTVLHARHNQTGEFMDRNRLAGLAADFCVPIVEEVGDFYNYEWDDCGRASKRVFDVDRLLDAAADHENTEGWVIQFADGTMVKVKTAWYMARHKVATFLRERDVAEMVLNETLDDIKSMMVSDGRDISQVLEVEQRVLSELREVYRELDAVYNNVKFQDRKGVAIKLKAENHPLFGLIMMKYSGKEPRVNDWFAVNRLKQNYGLRQLALGESIAEAD